MHRVRLLEQGPMPDCVEEVEEREVPGRRQDPTRGMGQDDQQEVPELEDLWLRTWGSAYSSEGIPSRACGFPGAPSPELHTASGASSAGCRSDVC